MEEKEFFTKTVDLANKLNVKLEENQAKKLYTYMNMLIEWNEKINLTAIIEPNEVILKHFIDSMTINKYIKPENTILDLGTGAGFPGIPLKIINEKSKFVLLDSLNKRINFLNEVCSELSLKNIECVHHRAEEAAKDEKYREKFDVVTSRAVARLNILLEYMLPYVTEGGKCICMKGPNAEEELEEAKKAIEILGGKIEKVEKLILPDSDIERNIIVISKIRKTPLKYPRKAGVPTKQPII